MNIKDNENMDFPLCFNELIWKGGGKVLSPKMYLKDTNTVKYKKVLVVVWAKFDFFNALLSPCPIYNKVRELLGGGSLSSCVIV